MKDAQRHPDLRNLRSWWAGVARRPTGLRDLEEISTETARLHGATLNPADLTLEAHSTLSRAYRALARSDDKAAGRALAACVVELLRLADVAGMDLAALLVARVGRDLRNHGRRRPR